MRKYKLFEKIIALSNAKDWEEAKKEWDLDSVYESEEPQTCLCGHYPIVNICVLYNVSNGQKVEVGNECVKKFFKIALADAIIKSIKKVKADISKSINLETLEYLFDKHFINDWEYGFYKDIKNKRTLTDRQFKKKQQINQEFLRFTSFGFKNKCSNNL